MDKAEKREQNFDIKKSNETYVTPPNDSNEMKRAAYENNSESIMEALSDIINEQS